MSQESSQNSDRSANGSGCRLDDRRGIFSLPQNMAASADVGAVLIGWAITAVGMLTLAFVFQTLANRKPELDGGVYAYAGRLRRLHGFLLGLGLLDQRLAGQRRLLRPVVQHPRLLLPDLRQGRHRRGDRLRLGPALGPALPGAARDQGGGVHQHRHHRGQGRAAVPVHPDLPVRLQAGHLHRRHLGQEQPGPGQRDEPGAQHDAGHRLRVIGIEGASIFSSRAENVPTSARPP